MRAESNNNSNTNAEQASAEQSASEKAKSKQAGKRKRGNVLQALDAELERILMDEAGTTTVNNLRICDFKSTHVSKLTVGLVLGLFHILTLTAAHGVGAWMTGPQQAEHIIGEIYSFSQPPLGFTKTPASYRKLSSWMQKMRSLAASGDLQGHQSLKSWLQSVIFPKVWANQGPHQPVIPLHPNLAQGHVVKSRWTMLPWKCPRRQNPVLKSFNLPEMVVAPSLLPALQGKKDAWGVFAPKDTPKGTIDGETLHSTLLSGTCDPGAWSEHACVPVSEAFGPWGRGVEGVGCRFEGAGSDLTMGIDGGGCDMSHRIRVGPRVPGET